MVEVGGCDVWAEDHVGVLYEEWSFALGMQTDFGHGVALHKRYRCGASCSARVIDLCSLSKAF